MITFSMHETFTFRELKLNTNRKNNEIGIVKPFFFIVKITNRNNCKRNYRYQYKLWLIITVFSMNDFDFILPTALN